ncbi:MAG: ABC transporter substrate-binding protein [Synergistaceae bacterium]|jgi:peptide/nickel transport system substrate-binding protein|nr:ABC transporter substrate-binding protein [Synergistaceae bacterium]
MTKKILLLLLSCCFLAASHLPSLAAQDVLTVACVYDAKTLDPHITNDTGSHLMMRQIYEKLVDFDENLNVVPNLAESWEISEDGKTYTFHLRRGVKFHNGEEMKASDVFFSFKRMLSPEAAAIHAYSKVIDPDSFKIIDDYTIVMSTKEPLGAFLASMNHGFASIVSEKAVTEAGQDYGVNPVGTGAFKFVSWAKGDRLTLERFDEYHGVKPALSKMILRAVTESTSRTIELESGAVDIVQDPPGSDVNRLEGNSGLKVMRMPGQLVYHMGFNLDKAPYDNIKVRQAMNIAVNRPGMAKVVYRGNATPATGPWTEAVKYAVTDAPQIAYDIERAKQLLKEAGYENGFKAVIWVPDRKEQGDMATILQSEYKKIGIDMEIKVYEWGAYIEALKDPEHELYIMGWSGGAPAPDPYFFAGPKFHSSVVGSSNRCRLNDKTVDSLIDRGAAMKDGPEREKIYKELYVKIEELLPWIVLVNPDQIFAAKKSVEGVDYGSSSITYYGNAYFK